MKKKAKLISNTYFSDDDALMVIYRTINRNNAKPITTPIIDRLQIKRV